MSDKILVVDDEAEIADCTDHTSFILQQNAQNRKFCRRQYKRFIIQKTFMCV